MTHTHGDQRREEVGKIFLQLELRNHWKQMRPEHCLNLQPNPLCLPCRPKWVRNISIQHWKLSIISYKWENWTHFMSTTAGQTKCSFHWPYFDKTVIRTSNNISSRAIKYGYKTIKLFIFNTNFDMIDIYIWESRGKQNFQTYPWWRQCSMSQLNLFQK